MKPVSLSSDAYLEAFMSGFEFVLLAMQGRLADPTLDAAERARVEDFLADYWRIAESYHARRPANVERSLAVQPFPVDLPPATAN